MKYLKQFLIIISVSFLGEILHALIPLPIPASIYGLVLMLAALCTGVIRLDQVRETGKFLVEIMSVMFIPAVAGLLDAWVDLKPICGQVIVIMVVTTILVMVVAGKVSQLVIKLEGRKESEDQ